jgi:hypothetical protein
MINVLGVKSGVKSSAKSSAKSGDFAQLVTSHSLDAKSGDFAQQDYSEIYKHSTK